MQILESTDFVDEAANIRTVYKRAFRDLVVEAIKGLEVSSNPRLKKAVINVSCYAGSILQDEEEERKLLKFNVDELGAVSNDGLTDSSEGNCSAFNELLASEKSRYAEDFIEMYCLGKGGFGHVFKVNSL